MLFLMSHCRQFSEKQNDIHDEIKTDCTIEELKNGT